MERNENLQELDERVAANAEALDKRLRLIEKQAADEAARFGPAPEPKASKLKVK